MSDESEKTAAGLAVDKVQAFIDELRNRPEERMISGMVKPADDSNGLMFAHAGDDNHWIFVSKSAVRTIHRTGRIQCNGRFYTLVDIELTAPQNEVEATLTQVAQLHGMKLARQTSADLGSAVSPLQCPPGQQPKQNQDGSWICVPTPL